MNQNEILELFEKANALLKGHFKLTSGRHSNIYYEKFNLLRQPVICTQICQEMAKQFDESGVETVVGPTTGGIILAYDVARYLKVESIYAEAGDNGRVFKRGFSLKKGRKVLIVDDILTTGKSLFEVIDLVKSYEADIVGVSVMLDRSGGELSFDYPFKPLASVDAISWDVDDCPLCKENEPITQRGSRVFQK